MARSLETTAELLEKRRAALVWYFEKGEKNYSEIARHVLTTRQNVLNWVKAELENRKTKKK